MAEQEKKSGEKKKPNGQNDLKTEEPLLQNTPVGEAPPAQNGVNAQEPTRQKDVPTGHGGLSDEELSEQLTQREEQLAPQKPTIKKTVKRIGIILFILINAVVIYFTARDEFTKDMPPMEPFSFTNILFLSGGILIVGIMLGCETVKFMMMMRHLGEKVSFRVAFETAALGRYYDCVTPSGAGGQPFQVWYLHSRGYSTGAASALPLACFCTTQFAFVFLAILVFIFGGSDIVKPEMSIIAYIGAFTYLIVPVMIVIAGVAPKIAMKIVAFVVKIGAVLHIVKNPNHATMSALKALNSYSKNLKKITKSKGLFFRLMLLSILYQASVSSLPFFAVHTFGGKIDFFEALALTVFIQSVVCLVPTPGNAGAAETSFYLIFRQLGEAGTFWAMLLWRMLCYYSFILIGLVIYGYTALLKLRKRKKETPVDDQA